MYKEFMKSIPFYCKGWAITLIALIGCSFYPLWLLMIVQFVMRKKKIAAYLESLEKEKEAEKETEIQAIYDSFASEMKELEEIEKNLEKESIRLLEQARNKIDEDERAWDKKRIHKEEELARSLEQSKQVIMAYDSSWEEERAKKERELDVLLEQKKGNAIRFAKQEKEDLERSLKELKDTHERLKLLYVEEDEKMLLQSFGFYETRYDFESVDEYKEELSDIKEEQKEMVRDEEACYIPNRFTFKSSEKEGEKMLKKYAKLCIRAFNTECDSIIAKVKFSNVDQSISRIEKSKEIINESASLIGIKITDEYVKLKKQELYISYEYAVQKQKEKELESERKAILKEAEAAEREALKQKEDEMKKLEKERLHFLNHRAAIQAQMDAADVEKKLELEKEIDKIAIELKQIDKKEEDAESRTFQNKAGYVYIISNIGSFGEDVYKIGVTRRMNPLDRVKELSDASVPFVFDVHALIFSEDAFALETALHQAFSAKKVNVMNNKKEFFNVDLREIKKVVHENHSKIVEWVDIPEAEEYRLSLVAPKESSPAA